MRIAISGASGFIGTYLSQLLSAAEYAIVPLNRQLFEEDMERSLSESLAECDVVINLAGAPINRKWDKRYKQEMYDSRVGVTRKIVSAINSLCTKPKLLISASAVGYYPAEGCFDEYNSLPGSGFLSELCVEWEKESQKVDPAVRLVNVRSGIVLAPKGGAFEKITMPAKLGVATGIGEGMQPFPWIDLEDYGRAIEFIIDHPALSGVINFVAPQQTDNREFTRLVASHYHSFITLRVPKLFFKMTMGEAAEIVVKGQCVKSAKLLESGFIFRSNSIEEFLERKVKVRS